jgi:hypothetical protein
LNGFSVQFFISYFSDLISTHSIYFYFVCAPRPRRKSICKPKGRQIFTKSTGTEHRNQRAGKSCVEREAACKPKGRHPLQTQKPSSQVFKQYTGTEEPQNSSHCHTGAEEQPQAVVLPSPREPKSSPLFHFLFFQIITTFYTSIISIGRNTLNFLIWFDQNF